MRSGWRTALRVVGGLAVVAALVLGFLRPTTKTVLSGDSTAGSATWVCPSPFGKWTGIWSGGYSLESQSANQAPLVAPSSPTGGRLFVAYPPVKACHGKTVARQYVVLVVGLLGLIVVAETITPSPGRRDADGAEL